MKLRSIALILAAVPVLAHADTNDFATGEVLVKYKSLSMGIAAKLAVGGTTIQTMPEINVQRIRVSGMTAQDALKIFKADPNVAYAELNPREHLFFDPNDPKLSQQYGINQVKARQAWDISKGSANTVVCVIDTGVNYNHEEFVGRIAPGSYDWSDNDSNVMDDTGSGHGTHTSGIAVANTNNSKGVASVCYNGKLLHMKIFPNSFASTSASAIIDATNKGARVISMSYGSSARNQTEQDAINYAWNKGVILFAAAGNNGDTVKHYPGALDNIIAVAATNAQDQRASFSTYGDWVHVAAPGEDIISTFYDGVTVTGNNGYAVESGTSMACPFAASIAGLMIGRNPSITNVKVRDILFNTADNVGPFVIKGRLNAYKAIQQVITPLPFTGNPIGPTVGVVAGVTEGTQVGSYANPTVAGSTIKLTDGTVFTIQSLGNQKVGSVATLDTFILIPPTLDSLITTNINITARSIDGASCLIFVYNNVTGAWDQFGSMSMSTSNKTASFSIPIGSIGKYLNGNNMVRIMARNISPARTGAKAYTFVIDQLNVTGTNKPSV